MNITIKNYSKYGYKQFAASGSCFAEPKIIIGEVKNQIEFISAEFSGIRNDQKFWDDLREYAHSENAYIYLLYKV